MFVLKVTLSSNGIEVDLERPKLKKITYHFTCIYSLFRNLYLFIEMYVHFSDVSNHSFSLFPLGDY